MDVPTPPPGPEPGALPVDPSIEGPLTVEQARALLDRAAELLGTGDFGEAGRYYQRVVGHPSADVTAAALLGLGEALFRLDEEDVALDAWQSVLRLPETPSTYPAWRNVAAARVRSGDLRGALAAYREAERRAPAADRPELASRLGWLTKELGNAGESRRWFARARGDSGILSLAVLVIAATTAISFACFTTGGAQQLVPLLELDKGAVANGEYWRLLTVTLVHANLLHLLFNMYALWLVGPLVERFYGSAVFALMYLLCAAAGSVASFVWNDVPSVGASGAIFGLFGVLIAVQRAHDPMIDRRTRAMLGQLLPIVVLNLVFGLFAGFIDIAAHVGGLLAGLWLGWILVPARVPTLSSRWQRPAGQSGTDAGLALLRGLGVLALAAVLVVGVVLGTQARGGPGTGGILSRVDPSKTAAGLAIPGPAGPGA